MSELLNNREHRIQVMKDIIMHLHQGGSPDEVRGKLRTLVRETDASEIAAMEQQLMADGMPVAEVQSISRAWSATASPARPKSCGARTTRCAAS